MVIPAEQSAASLVGWPLEQQHIVRPLGLSLGLGLMTLGRFLYNPCLFYLPAVLLGYAMIQPMSAYLTAEMGLSHHAIALLGAHRRQLNCPSGRLPDCAYGHDVWRSEWSSLPP